MTTTEAKIDFLSIATLNDHPSAVGLAMVLDLGITALSEHFGSRMNKATDDDHGIAALTGHGAPDISIDLDFGVTALRDNLLVLADRGALDVTHWTTPA